MPGGGGVLYKLHEIVTTSVLSGRFQQQKRETVVLMSPHMTPLAETYCNASIKGVQGHHGWRASSQGQGGPGFVILHLCQLSWACGSGWGQYSSPREYRTLQCGLVSCPSPASSCPQPSLTQHWVLDGLLTHWLACFTTCVLCLLPEYIQKYATEEALKEQEEGTGDSSSESSMSDFSEDEAQDMELQQKKHLLFRKTIIS